MKSQIIFLWACCMLLATACNQGTKEKEKVAVATDMETTFSEAAELKAIMEVIDRETNCFYERNFDCWKSQWADKEQIALTWNNEDGSFETNSGAALAEFVRKYLEDHPLQEGQQSRHPELKRENIKVQFFGDNAAYLSWKQYNSNQDATEYTISQDFRVMEKIDGEWKIVNVSSFWDYPNPVAADNM